MTTTVFRASNGRFVAAAVVLGFLILEAVTGGQALGAVVQQAVLAQSAMSVHITR